MSKKTNLYVMVGLVGSGKTTYANKLKKEKNCVLLSSDTIRKELFGDENSQIDNTKVFEEMHKRMKEYLNNDINVIYDATNVSRKSRSFIRNLGRELRSNVKITAIIKAVPYCKCLDNNRKRKRNVPVEAIRKMYMTWNTPMYYEGFDDIHIVYDEDTVFDTVDIETIQKKFGKIDQCNSHHKLFLADHMVDAYSRFLKTATENYINCVTNGIEFDELQFNKIRYISKALLLHDIGKPFTKTYKNIVTGNIDDDAHYYQHHCVGSYDALFYYSKDDYETLMVSWLVGEHMYPYFIKTDREKVFERYKKKIGGYLYDMVMTIHQCDKEAH